MRIATLSGSLQERSSSTALIRAARDVAPDGVDLVVFRSLGDVPWLERPLEPELNIIVEARSGLLRPAGVRTRSCVRGRV